MQATTPYAVLKEARSRFSQREIAEALSVDVKTVRRWELRENDPPPYVVDAIRQRLLPLGSGRSDAAFTFIDLFAGIGGIRMGFEQQGGHCVFTSEWNPFAVKTYMENYPPDASHMFAGDITAVDADDVPDHDVLLAGFPCQPFSIAGVSKKNALGRPHGFECTTQGTLFFDVARIIARKKPKAFLLENVKNLLSHDKGNTFRVILQTLREELGYNVQYRVIDGQHFVPQHRERIIIVGFRDDCGFSFDDLELPKSGPCMSSILHPEDGSETVEEPYTSGALGKVNSKYTLTPRLWEYLQAYAEKHRAAGNGFGFGMVNGESVARTLSARYYKDGSEILVQQKRKRPRRLTPRECARLMGFPDTFKIPVSDTQAYQLFAHAAVVPMISEVAKMLASAITKEQARKAAQPEVPRSIMSSGKWTKEQVKLAFHLYCQLPYGRIHSRNPEIIELAALLGRTPSALAMKMLNLASLDPVITNSGRSGLGNASSLDKLVWDEFHADWELLATECEIIKCSLLGDISTGGTQKEIEDEETIYIPEDYTGETKQVVTQQRIKQHFFRRSVLSSYGGRCCMSGVSDSRMLIASHIVPWSKDKANRLNPSNGLCLSAIHDKAFDKGLISLTNDMRVIVSEELIKSDNKFIVDTFSSISGRRIEIPEKFIPGVDFISRHRDEIFVDSIKLYSYG